MTICSRRQRCLTSAILLAAFLGVSSASPAGQAAAAAAEECRVLVRMEVYNQAIKRCEEAVRLDPKSPDPYFMLGQGHYALSPLDATTSADDVNREHRRKAAENFKKFLALNRGDTEGSRRLTHLALMAVLAIYSLEDKTDEAVLEYVNRLAEEPSLERFELLMLAKLYSRHARPELAEKSLKRQLEADRSDAEACQDLATLYNEPVWNGRSRSDDSLVTLERCAAQSPDDPTGYYRVATFVWDKAYRDASLGDTEKLAYIERGLTHVDRALALKRDLWEALVFKGLLLRLKAMAVSDLALQQRLILEAGVLQQRALQLKADGVPPFPGLPASRPPSPPAPPAGSGGVAGGVPGGMVGGVVGGFPDAPPPPDAVRVGGEIKEPKKLRDVRPDYPGIAQQARVQGVVILECTIAPDGTVVGVRVLRSIPLLDAAAIDAVRQWIYTPTLLNDVPVHVIMTVTVKFTLS